MATPPSTTLNPLSPVASDPFQVSNGVKQGCVIVAPTLFSLMFSAMLTYAFREILSASPSSTGATERCSSAGVCRPSGTKVIETMIRDLLFADDCALNAISEQETQQEMDAFSSACDHFWPSTISTKKTEVMYQPAPGKPGSPPQGQRLQAVDNFTYLGSTLSRLRQHRCRSQQPYCEGRLRLWKIEEVSVGAKRISQPLCTRIKEYRAVVLKTSLWL